LDLHQSYNLQVQYIPAEGARWVGSVGVQHINGGVGSQGNGGPFDDRTSRSAFGVVTYRWDTSRSPIYLSAGIGTRRFKPFFGSISHQVTGPLRVWVEHDTFGVNYGVLGTWLVWPHTHRTEINLLLGIIKGKYFTFSLGTGF